MTVLKLLSVINVSLCLLELCIKNRPTESLEQLNDLTDLWK